MYPVSNAFLNAVKANTRKYYWTGRITTAAGTVYNFDQEDMVKGSGYITSQCCGSTEIELGTVYAAEMGISLFSEINRYTLEDAKVELFYHLQVAGGSYERIPMGIFEVSEANRKAKCLEIKAYDYMVRFEKAFTSLESIGNAYDFMVLCSTACDVTLYTRDTHFDDYMSTEEGKNLPVPHCIKGSDGWQIASALTEEESDAVIFDKVTFGSRELGRFMADNYSDAESIEFIGLCTDICVISNALLVKAFCPNTPINVDATCCAGVTPASHDTALKAMGACQIHVSGEGEEPWR